MIIPTGYTMAPTISLEKGKKLKSEETGFIVRIFIEFKHEEFKIEKAKSLFKHDEEFDFEKAVQRLLNLKMLEFNEDNNKLRLTENIY